MKILWNHVRNYRRRMNCIRIQNKFVFNIKIKFLIVAKFIYKCVLKINLSSLQDLVLRTHRDSSSCVLCHLLQSFYFHTSKIYFFISFIIYYFFLFYFFSNRSYLYWSPPIHLQHRLILLIQKGVCIYSYASYRLN